MQLNYVPINLHTFLCNGDDSVCIITGPYYIIILCSNVYKKLFRSILLNKFELMAEHAE